MTNLPDYIDPRRMTSGHLVYCHTVHQFSDIPVEVWKPSDLRAIADHMEGYSAMPMCTWSDGAGRHLCMHSKLSGTEVVVVWPEDITVHVETIPAAEAHARLLGGKVDALAGYEPKTERGRQLLEQHKKILASNELDRAETAGPQPGVPVKDGDIWWIKSHELWGRGDTPEEAKRDLLDTVREIYGVDLGDPSTEWAMINETDNERLRAHLDHWLTSAHTKAIQLLTEERDALRAQLATLRKNE